jgi:hypothetical protein
MLGLIWFDSKGSSHWIHPISTISTSVKEFSRVTLTNTSRHLHISPRRVKLDRTASNRTSIKQ